jgi:hypothetical protein
MLTVWLCVVLPIQVAARTVRCRVRIVPKVKDPDLKAELAKLAEAAAADERPADLEWEGILQLARTEGWLERDYEVSIGAPLWPARDRGLPHIRDEGQAWEAESTTTETHDTHFVAHASAWE